MPKTKSKSIKKIRFRVDGRTAILDDTYYLDELKEILSFSAPGAQFSPAYKQWLRTKREYNEDPENADPPSGWNGKVSMIKNGIIGVGLLLGFREKLRKAGFKIKLVKWRNRPSIEMRKGFKSKDPKYFYQNDCVHAMRECIHHYGGGLVIAATGSGKTKISAQLFSGLKCDVLFVVDQVDLLYQSQKEIAEWLEREGYEEKVGVVGNSKFEPERITVATIQTLHKHRNTPRFVNWRKSIGLVVIDEIHVQMSRRNFDVVTSINPQAVIGLTATLQMRKKNVAMKAMNICGPVVYSFPIEKGVAAGVLSKGVVVQIELPDNKQERRWVKVKSVDKKTGETIIKEHEADDYEHSVVFNPSLDKAIRQLVSEALKRKRATAVLVERVRHVRRLSKHLGHHKPKLFYGAVSVEDRKKSTKKFEKGYAELIIANKVFTKGVNIKRLDLAIDGAMRQSKNDCLQKFGRTVRLHVDKDGAIYFTLGTPMMQKSMDSQRSAFKQAKIPFIRIKWTSAKDALDVAQRELKKASRKGNNA